MDIHICVPQLPLFDGVANTVRYQMTMLEQLGLYYKTYTYNEKDQYLDAHTLPDKIKREDILIIHYADYFEEVEKYVQVNSSKKILYFHNLTPPDLLGVDTTAAKRVDLASKQLDKIIHYFDLVVCNSPITIQELHTRFNINDTALEVTWFPPILEGVPTNEIWAPSDKSNNFLCLGRFDSFKNIEYAINLFKLYSETSPDAHLFIIGKGDPTKLNQILADERVSQKISVLGEISENKKNKLLKNARYLLNLSKHEGFGIPYLEAVKHQCIPLFYFEPLISLFSEDCLIRSPDDFLKTTEKFNNSNVSQHNLLKADLLKNSQKMLSQKFHNILI